MAPSADAHVRFKSPLGDELRFQHMQGEEELGQPFKYDVTLLSENSHLALDDLLGETVTVELDLPDSTPTENDKTRYFHGYVTRLSRQGVHGRDHVYFATIRPWLWLLSRSSNCRIFPLKDAADASVAEIIKSVFRAHGMTDFEDHIKGKYQREFVVQYRETDLNFVSRLMEEYGIYYFFRHEAGKHTLVLTDSSIPHKTVKGYEEVPYYPSSGTHVVLDDHIDDWGAARQIQPGTVFLKDFDFEDPNGDLLVSRSAPNAHKMAKSERYEYPGGFLNRGVGEELARIRHEELDVRYEQFKASGNARGLTTGCLFRLKGGPVGTEDSDYLLTAASFSIEGPDYESGGSAGGDPYRCSFAAIDSKCPFRTEASTPHPTIAGPQTATVVGDKDQEITTDEYGRVKVKFHWDRRTGNQKEPSKVDKNKNDPNSSCWVRVAQMWAGAGFGAINIPRVGDEVIVDFLEGDPDRPIITGRVYNKTHMPPYTLEDHKTQTGIKTRSVGEGANADNFNEIRFEDLKGKEELHIQAERDMSTHVKRNQTTTVDGNQTITVIGNQSITVKGKGKSPVHSVSSVTGKHTFDASDTIKIQAPTSITLECGGSTLVMEPGKITITAGGGATIVLDGNALTKASGGGKTLHDANVLHQSNGGAKVLLDANVLAQSNGGSTVVLDGNAAMEGKGTATVKGATEATLTAGGAVKTTPAGVEATGTKIDVTGSAAVNVTGAMVKIN